MPIKRRRKGVLTSLVDKGLDKFLSADPKAPPSSSHRQQGRSGSQSSNSSSSTSDSASSSSSEAGRGDRHRNRSLPSRPPKTVQTESRSPVPAPWPYPNMSITECLLSLPNDDWVRSKHLPLKHYLGACRNYRRYAKGAAKLTIFDIPYGKDGWSTATLARVEAALRTDLAFNKFDESDKQCVLQWLAGAQRLQSQDERAEAKSRDAKARYDGGARQ